MNVASKIHKILTSIQLYEPPPLQLVTAKHLDPWNTGFGTAPRAVPTALAASPSDEHVQREHRPPPPLCLFLLLQLLLYSREVLVQKEGSS